jgi:hypothetical protein
VVPLESDVYPFAAPQRAGVGDDGDGPDGASGHAVEWANGRCAVLSVGGAVDGGVVGGPDVCGSESV